MGCLTLLTFLSVCSAILRCGDRLTLTGAAKKGPLLLPLLIILAPALIDFTTIPLFSVSGPV
jgi:hypothetical protein